MFKKQRMMIVILLLVVAGVMAGGWQLAAQAAGFGQDGDGTRKIALPAVLNQSGQEQQAIDIATKHPEVSAYLADYPGWTAEAYEEEEGGLWGVDFYDAQEEWIGYVAVDMPAAEVVEYYAPKELTPEEFAAGKSRVEKIVLQDAEVLALLGNPNEWEYETSYDRFEQAWYVGFWKGLDEWEVIVWTDGEDYFLEIVDPQALDAVQQQALQRDQAIELAYEADGVDTALAGLDDWRTYVEDQGDGRWTVSFVAGGQEQFHALVDIDSWQILSSQTSQVPPGK